tara:strand:+ start:6824 stop:7423 length:600 start_codon:yes stop_codon:yes gene_type:complete
MPVDIHGTPYKKVVERLNEFHKDHKENKSIITEIIQFKDGIVVIKAAVKIGDDVFTGHAYEEVGSSQVNENSALENGETSAIGRALASAGYAGSEFASADEMQNALHKQKSGYKMKTPDGGKRQMIGEATEKQIGYIKKLNDEKGLFTDDKLEVEMMNLSKQRASELIEALQNADNSVDDDEEVEAVKVGEVKPEEIPF